STPSAPGSSSSPDKTMDKPMANDSKATKDTSAAAGGTKKKSSMGAAGGQNADMIKQAQEKLAAEGIDVGPADGKMGPKTKAGIKKYQEQKGLSASGNLDEATLSSLGITGSSASTGASSSKKSKDTSAASGSSSSKPSDTSSKPSDTSSKPSDTPSSAAGGTSTPSSDAKPEAAPSA